MSGRWVVGVDIGGTNLVVGMIPARGGDPVGLAQAVVVPVAVAAVRLLTVVEAAVPHPRAVRCPGALTIRGTRTDSS